MLFSVEQAFVGRDEIRAPLKEPAWGAVAGIKKCRFLRAVFDCTMTPIIILMR